MARTRCAAAAPLRERRRMKLCFFPHRPIALSVAAQRRSRRVKSSGPSTPAFGLRSGRTAEVSSFASASAFAVAFALASSRVRARMARRSTRGPCAAVRRGRQGPEGGIGRMPMLFRQHMDVLSKSIATEVAPTNIKNIAHRGAPTECARGETDPAAVGAFALNHAGNQKRRD